MSEVDPSQSVIINSSDFLTKLKGTYLKHHVHVQCTCMYMYYLLLILYKLIFIHFPTVQDVTLTN